MTKIFNGRYTAHSDESFVVFLFGIRINRLRAVRKWLPVTQAILRRPGALCSQPL